MNKLPLVIINCFGSSHGDVIQRIPTPNVKSDYPFELWESMILWKFFSKANHKEIWIPFLKEKNLIYFILLYILPKLQSQ